jgi:signal transduction histidine kinase
MATASHELRTPLQTIIGCVDLLEQQPGEIRNCLPELRDAADQMSGIAADLVEFVRADHAPGVSFRNLDPRELLERALAAARKHAAAKGLLFVSDFTRLTETLSLDDKRVRQVVSNLAMNAVKYTLEGEVSVSACVIGSEGRLSLRVVISDTGPGMPEGLTRNVLQPFVRGPDSEAIDPQGLGMGLAIVQSHLAELGGTLEIESEVGAGSSITMSVPCTLA